MKLYAFIFSTALIASASMYGMDGDTATISNEIALTIDDHAATIPNSKAYATEIVLEGCTMEAQEQITHNDNAHFKSSGYSDLNKKRSHIDHSRSYTDDFAQLFPYGQPEEWTSSAAVCCLVCPVVTAMFIKDKCCSTAHLKRD